MFHIKIKVYVNWKIKYIHMYQGLMIAIWGL